jgi:hypothetical protein
MGAELYTKAIETCIRHRDPDPAHARDRLPWAL